MALNHPVPVRETLPRGALPATYPLTFRIRDAISLSTCRGEPSMTGHTLGRHTACVIRPQEPTLPGRWRRAACVAWRYAFWPAARAGVLVWLLASTPGCYHYQV